MSRNMITIYRKIGASIGGLVMKKRHFVLVIILTLIGMFIAFSAAAHPYDDPLTFILHKTDDGRPIYTNIPKKCFSNSALTCVGLHPIFGTPVKNKKAASRTTKKAGVKEGDARPDDPSGALPIELSESSNKSEFKLSTTHRKCYRKGTIQYEQTRYFTPYASLEECKKARKNSSKSSSDALSLELSESLYASEFKLSTTHRKCYRKGTIQYEQTKYYTPHATLEECKEARKNLSKSSNTSNY